MPHIRQKGSLQPVTFLCPVTGIDKGRFHMFLLVDTHRGTHNLRGHAIGIAISHHGKTLFPIDLSRGHTLGLILLVVEHRTSRDHILQSRHHALRVIRHKQIRQKVERGLNSRIIIINSLTEISIESKGTRLTIDMPCGQLHGLQYKIILNIVLTNLIQLQQLLTDFFPVAILKNDTHNEKNHQKDANTPHNGVKVGI